MARTSSYVVIQDSTSVLSPTVHVEFPQFAAPDADLNQRPVLTFRVGHSGDDARLVITLNTLEVVNVMFTTTPTRAWIEVVDHNILQQDVNELIASVTEGTGEISVSDLTLFYKNVLS
jgi:hypothetical protein